MAFPASSLRLAPTLDNATATLQSIKAFSTDRRTKMAAGNVASDVILSMWLDAYAQRAKLQSFAAVPGLPEYAQEQYGNAELDIAAEFMSVVNALTAVINNIASTFPKDANGFLLAYKFGAGVYDQQQFTPAQTATLRGLMQTLEGTIA